MRNKPLTNKLITNRAYSQRLIDLFDKEDVQSAVSLLKEMLSNNIQEIVALIVNDESITMDKKTFEYIRDRIWELIELPDKCFQIGNRKEDLYDYAQRIKGDFKKGMSYYSTEIPAREQIKRGNKVLIVSEAKGDDKDA